MENSWFFSLSTGKLERTKIYPIENTILLWHWHLDSHLISICLKSLTVGALKGDAAALWSCFWPYDYFNQEQCFRCKCRQPDWRSCWDSGCKTENFPTSIWNFLSKDVDVCQSIIDKCEMKPNSLEETTQVSHCCRWIPYLLDVFVVHSIKGGKEN